MERHGSVRSLRLVNRRFSGRSALFFLFCEVGKSGRNSSTLDKRVPPTPLIHKNTWGRHMARDLTREYTADPCLYAPTSLVFQSERSGEERCIERESTGISREKRSRASNGGLVRTLTPPERGRHREGSVSSVRRRPCQPERSEAEREEETGLNHRHHDSFHYAWLYGSDRRFVS